MCSGKFNFFDLLFLLVLSFFWGGGEIPSFEVQNAHAELASIKVTVLWQFNNLHLAVGPVHHIGLSLGLLPRPSVLR